MTLKEAMNAVEKELQEQYGVLFSKERNLGEPIFHVSVSTAVTEAIRFLADNGTRTNIYSRRRNGNGDFCNLVEYKTKTNEESGDVTPEESVERLADATKAFKDSLLYEQKERIEDLEMRLEQAESDYINKVHDACVRGREIARLNEVIHRKKMMIKNLISERGRIARELSAEKAIHKIDLQSTESAESALVYKEKEYEESLQEKDEVIEEISKELAHSKEREGELLATIKDYLKEIDELKNGKVGAATKVSEKKSQRGFSFSKEGVGKKSANNKKTRSIGGSNCNCTSNGARICSVTPKDDECIVCYSGYSYYDLLPW